MSYQWNLAIVVDRLPILLEGLRLSIILAMIVMAFSLPFGFLVALTRISRYSMASKAGYLFTELFRTTPALVQILFIYYMFPVGSGLLEGPLVPGIVALTLNLTAFIAEIFRGSIASINPGQWEAALSTGMTRNHALRRVIAPQAIRRAIPLIAYVWISLFKDTSLLATIGVQELTYVARAESSTTFRPIELLTLAAVLYFVVTYPQSLLANRLFEKFRVHE